MREKGRAGQGSSRAASISTKPGGGQSKCDRGRAERSRLGSSPANHWSPVQVEDPDFAGRRITVVTTGYRDWVTQ